MDLRGFNIALFRVECPVCKRRRELRAIEISEIHHHGTYRDRQFCSDLCSERANESQRKAVIDCDPIYKLKKE